MDFVDVIILGVMLISALFAFSRGFAREAVSLFSWIATAVAVYYVFPIVRPYAHASIGSGVYADAMALFVVFFAFLTLLSYISSKLAGRLKTGRTGSMDRSLGFAYGLGRGLILIASLYWVLGFTTYQTEQPRFLADASLMPLVDTTARTLEAYFPSESRTYQMGLAQTADNNYVSPTSAEDEEGYASSERRALDQLIESTSGD